MHRATKVVLKLTKALGLTLGDSIPYSQKGIILTIQSSFFFKVFLHHMIMANHAA